MNFSSMVTPSEYRQAAYLARVVAAAMIERLQMVTLHPKAIVDLGCGTGIDLAALGAHFPAAEVYGLDLAEDFLLAGKSELALQNLPRPPQWIMADAASLPFFTASVDLIFANLLLPWCSHPKPMLREWRRILRPQGLLVFSCLGPDSFKEWSQIENFTLLPSLVDMHIVGDALIAEGFVDPVMEVEELYFTYTSEEKLRQELCQSGFVKQDQLPRTQALPLTTTFEIIYAHAWCPAHKGFKANAQGTVNIPVSELRKRS